MIVPNHRFVNDAPTAPVNAPASNMPSIAMLITPLRSHKMPPIAPSVIGTLRETVSCNMPTRLNDSPEVAHDKKLITNIAVARASTIFETLPSPRQSWAAPRPIKTMPKIQANCCAGIVRFAPPSVNLKPASPGRREKITKVITARPIYPKPTFRARFFCSAEIINDSFTRPTP